MLSQTKEEKMVKLTDSQLIVLSKAAAREDSAAVVPLRMNKAAAAKIGSSLIGRKLMREIRSKPGMPVWREDEDGRSMSLVITRAGRRRSASMSQMRLICRLQARAALRGAPIVISQALHRVPDPNRRSLSRCCPSSRGESDGLASPYDAGGLDGSS
jgi:hypothetical protein